MKTVDLDLESKYSLTRLAMYSDKVAAKIWIRTLLATTDSTNIEANVEFLYSLITGKEA